MHIVWDYAKQAGKPDYYGVGGDDDDDDDDDDNVLLYHNHRSKSPVCINPVTAHPNPLRIAHNNLHFIHKELSHHEVQIYTAKKLSSSNLSIENLNKWLYYCSSLNKKGQEF